MLGHAFARVLEDRGANFTAVARDQCDIADPLAVENILDEAKPSLIINCAGYTKVDLAEKEPQLANLCNGVGPSILATECRQRDIALVHFSTDYVFDGTLRRPLRPDDPVGPVSAYGKSKLLGEQAIIDHPPPRWLIARTAWLYGPSGANFVRTMVNAARAGKSLSVVNDQLGSPTYTFDLATTTLDLLNYGATGVWHISNSGETTWFDFARAIFEEWGLSPQLAPTTSAEWKAKQPTSATRPAYSVFDVTPIAQLLGEPIRGWREALRAFKRLVDQRGEF
jgi:dTDP-4-dehydrorhamnose reductase